MKPESVPKIVEQFLRAYVYRLMYEKNAGYAADHDFVENFKRGAEEAGITPLQYWFSLFYKHYRALRTYIRTGATNADIREVLGDLVNYILLLYLLGVDAGDIEPVPDFMSVSEYRELFFACFGPGPFTCVRCGEKIPMSWDSSTPHSERLLIHHDDIDNVVLPMHKRCHLSYHTGLRATKGEMQRRAKLAHANVQMSLFSTAGGADTNRGRKRTVKQRRHIADGVGRSWDARKDGNALDEVVCDGQRYP